MGFNEHGLGKFERESLYMYMDMVFIRNTLLFNLFYFVFIFRKEFKLIEVACMLALASGVDSY